MANSNKITLFNFHNPKKLSNEAGVRQQTLFSYFWLLLATFGYLWLIMATYGYCWLLLANIFKTVHNSWQFSQNFHNF